MFNIGTGTSHTVLETVKLAECFTGRKARIEHGPAHPADVPETLASPVKARNLLGWEPTVALRQGLKPTIDYFASLDLSQFRLPTDGPGTVSG